jgi:hypothetical protein
LAESASLAGDERAVGQEDQGGASRAVTAAAAAAAAEGAEDVPPAGESARVAGTEAATEAAPEAASFDALVVASAAVSEEVNAGPPLPAPLAAPLEAPWWGGGEAAFGSTPPVDAGGLGAWRRQQAGRGGSEGSGGISLGAPLADGVVVARAYNDNTFIVLPVQPPPPPLSPLPFVPFWINGVRALSHRHACVLIRAPCD